MDVPKLLRRVGPRGEFSRSVLTIAARDAAGIL